MSLIAPRAAVPQLTAASGVLAFVPCEVVTLPHVLSTMSLFFSVADVNVTAALPGALITPMPLLWMWLRAAYTRVAADVGATTIPALNR
jgi:hypothetical protein